MASPGGSSSATRSIPPLREIPVSTLASVAPPVLRIKTDEDVELWKHTRGYQDYGLFLRRLAESVVGYELPYSDPNPDKVCLLICPHYGALLNGTDSTFDFE